MYREVLDHLHHYINCFLKPVRIFAADINCYLDLIFTNYMCNYLLFALMMLWYLEEWMASCFKKCTSWKTHKQPLFKSRLKEWNTKYTTNKQVFKKTLIKLRNRLSMWNLNLPLCMAIATVKYSKQYLKQSTLILESVFWCLLNLIIRYTVDSR